MISIYTRKEDNRIIDYENKLLKQYSQLIEKHFSSLELKDYSIKIGFFWKTNNSDEISYERIDFKNKYVCYVYCAIIKDNKVVMIPSNDGEADFYYLSASWQISTIYRQFFNLKISLEENIDSKDVEEQFKWFKLLLEGSYFKF